MNLVIHQVVQLDQIHPADTGLLIEGLARPAVEELHLPAARHVGENLVRPRRLAVLRQSAVALGDLAIGLVNGRVNLFLAGAIEDRRHRLEAEHARGPAEVGLQNLAHVHPARHAERVQQHVHRRAVIEERHVLLRHDPRDHALVAVPAGHLVAHRQRPLGRHVNLDHLKHARGQLVAALHVRQLALLLFLERFDPRPELVVNLLRLLARLLVALDPRKVEIADLLGHNLRDLALAHLLTRGGVHHLGAGDLVDLLDHLAEQLRLLRVHLRLVLAHLTLELLLLLVGQMHPAGETLGPDDNAFRAGRHFERVVFHVLAGPAEDRVQQLLFRGQLALALGRDLAHEDVARLHVSAGADNPVLVQLLEHLLRDVGNVGGELLPAELGLADLNVELLDVNRGEHIVLHQPLADDNRVLEVVPVEGAEGRQHVLAQRQFAVVRAGPVGNNLVLLHLLPELDDRLLVLTRPLVQPDVLAKLVLVGVVDDDALRIDVGHRAAILRPHEHARVLGHIFFHARRHARRLGLDQRDRLPLHVRAHQRAVRVVVFEERNQRRRHAHDLLRADVHVINLLRVNLRQIAVHARQHRPVAQLALLVQRIRRAEGGLHFLIRAEVLHLAVGAAVVDLAVRRQQKAVLVDHRVNAKRGDQPDVGPLRRLDRANAAIVRDMHVPHLEAGPFPVQTARPERRQPPLVGHLAQAVGLVHNLAQFTPAEEVVDRAGNRLAVDQVRDLRQLVGVLDAHPLLHGPTELEKALAKLLDRQFVQRPQPAVAQVVDVVNVSVVAVVAQVDHVLHHVQEIARAQLHLRLFDIELKLPVDPEPPDLTEPIPALIKEFLIKKLAGFVHLRRVARPKAGVQRQKRRFVLRELRIRLKRLLFLRNRVEDEHVAGVGDDIDLLQARVHHLFHVLPDLRSDRDQLFPRLGVDDRSRGIVLGPHILSLDRLHVVERAKQVLRARVLLIHRAEERRGRDLRGLVDAHLEHVLLGHLQLDPRPTLGDDPRRMQRAIALTGGDREVHARRAVKLVDDDALGPVDDVFAATHHHRHLAEVNLFLGHLGHVLPHQPHAHAERPAVGQPKLAAFVGVVPRLVQLVIQILQRHGPVV